MIFNDNVVSLDQFGPGFQFVFPRVTAEERWDKWYNSDFASLWPEPSIDNGLKLIKEQGDLITMPLFQIASDFYTEATVSERPAVSTDSEELRVWLEDNETELYKAIRRGVRKWSIKGRLILATHDDGTLREVDPTAYFRVGSFEDPDDLVGHVIAYRYYEYDELELKSPFSYRHPNRVRVIKYAPEQNINTVQVFGFAGHVIGEPMTGLEPAGISALCVGGDGDSWYGDAQRVAAQFMIRLTNNQRVLNLHDNRPLLLPQSILANNAPGDTRTNTQRLQAFRELISPVVTYHDEDKVGSIGVVGKDYALVEARESLFQLATLYYLISGLPPSAFGINIGRNESGEARARAQDRAAARIRSLREDLSRCLPVLIKGMGAPEGDIKFSWRTSPFDNRDEREARILEMYSMDQLVGRNEARTLLGLGMEDPEDVKERMENRAMDQQRMNQAEGNENMSKEGAF